MDTTRFVIGAKMLVGALVLIVDPVPVPRGIDAVLFFLALVMANIGQTLMWSVFLDE